MRVLALLQSASARQLSLRLPLPCIYRRRCIRRWRRARARACEGRGAARRVSSVAAGRRRPRGKTLTSYEPAAPSAASKLASDPFYAVRDALQAEVEAVRVRFDAWRSALASTNTAADAAFQRQHQGARRAPAPRPPVLRPLPSACVAT